MKKKTANRPKLVAKATAVALLKVGRRKNSSRRTGSALRFSITTNATKATAAVANSNSIHQVPKPAFSPSITAKVTAVTATGSGHETRDVERPPLRIGALVQRSGCRHEREQPEREVEPEDPAPAGAGDEDPAEHRPERERDPGDRRPDAECPRPLAVVRVDLPDQRQRARLARGGADAHHDAPGDQRV